MIDLDQVVLRRADEQVHQVRYLTADGTGRCACGKPLKSARGAGAKPKTCGAKACRQARIYAQRAAKARRSA